MMNYLHRYFLTLVLCPCLLFWNISYAHAAPVSSAAVNLESAIVTVGKADVENTLGTAPLTGKVASTYEKFLAEFNSTTLAEIEKLERKFQEALNQQIEYQKQFDQSIGITKDDATYQSSIRGLTDQLEKVYGDTATARSMVEEADKLVDQAQKTLNPNDPNLRQAIKDVKTETRGSGEDPLVTLQDETKGNASAEALIFKQNSPSDNQPSFSEEYNKKLTKCLTKYNYPQQCRDSENFQNLSLKEQTNCQDTYPQDCLKYTEEAKSVQAQANATRNEICGNSSSANNKNEAASRDAKNLSGSMQGVCGSSNGNQSINAATNYAGGMSGGKDDKGQRGKLTAAMDKLYTTQMSLNQRLNNQAQKAILTANEVFKGALNLINNNSGIGVSGNDNTKNIEVTKTLQECVTARTNQDKCEEQLTLLLGSSVGGQSPSEKEQSFLEKSLYVTGMTTAAVFEDYFSCRPYTYADLPDKNLKSNNSNEQQDFVDSISYHLFRAANALYVAKRIIYASVFNRIGEEIAKLNFGNPEEAQQMDAAKNNPNDQYTSTYACVDDEQQYDEQVCSLQKALFLEKITSFLLITQAEAQTTLRTMLGQIRDIAKMEHESAKARQAAAFTAHKESKDDTLLLIAIVGMVVAAVTIAAQYVVRTKILKLAACIKPPYAGCVPAIIVYIAACVLFAAMTALLVYQLLNQKDSKSRTDKFTKEKQYAAVHMALICKDPVIEDPKELLKEAEEKAKVQTSGQVTAADQNHADSGAQAGALSSEGLDTGSTRVTTSMAAASNGGAVKLMADTSSSKGSVRVASENLASSEAVNKAQMMNRDSAEYRRYLEQRNDHALWMSSKYDKKEVDGIQRYEEFSLDYSYSSSTSSANEELALIWMHHNFCISGNKNQRQQEVDAHDVAANNMGIWRACYETAYSESDGSKNRSGSYRINDGFELPQGRVNYLDHLLLSLDGIIDEGLANAQTALNRLKEFNELLSIAQSKMHLKSTPSFTPRQNVQSDKAKNYDQGTSLIDNDVLVGDSGLGISTTTSVSPNDLATYSSLSYGGDLDAGANANGQKVAGAGKAKGILNSLFEKLKKLKEQKQQENDRRAGKSSGKNRKGGKGKVGRLSSAGGYASSSIIDPNGKAEILNDDASANGQKAGAAGKQDGQNDKVDNPDARSVNSAWQDFMNKYGRNGSNQGSGNNNYNNQNQNGTGNGPSDSSGLSAEEKADIEDGLRNQKALQVNDDDSLWVKITKTYQKRAYPTLLKLKKKKGRR